MLEFTIAPSGEITACRVVSSELNDPELEKKIVARVRLIRFKPGDVEPLTVSKPIDFFPAGLDGLAAMNLQSEIAYYSEIRIADKARLMASFLTELTGEARATYGASQESVHDGAHLRFVNEMCNRVMQAHRAVPG